MLYGTARITEQPLACERRQVSQQRNESSPELLTDPMNDHMTTHGGATRGGARIIILDPTYMGVDPQCLLAWEPCMNQPSRTCDILSFGKDPTAHNIFSACGKSVEALAGKREPVFSTLIMDDDAPACLANLQPSASCKRRCHGVHLNEYKLPPQRNS